MTKRKIFSIVLTLLLTIVLIACKPKNNFSDEIKVEFFTLSSENYIDDKEEKEEYYLNRLTDYNINIYLENENSYQIKSITIDKTKYLSDDFSAESTNSKIVISKNTENDSGIHNFEINEIIFLIDGSEKTTRLENNHSFKLYVQARFNPTAALQTETIGYNSYELTLSITDRNNLIDFEAGNAKLYLYENDEVLETKDLKLDDNDFEFKDLKIDEKYEYKVIAKYDDFSGEGIQEKTLFEGNFNTLPPFIVEVTEETESKIYFNYLMGQEVSLEKIFIEKDGTYIKDISENSNVVENLDEGETYNIVFVYNYNFDNKVINKEQRIEVKTYELTYENVIRNGRNVKHPDGTDVMIPSYKEKNEEVRGIWVSTVSNIDLARMQGSNIEEYKGRIRLIFDNIKAANLNTVFFQIRPMNDAFYPSELAPWSRYVTGTEGKDPGFDLLEFVIEEAHSRGLELHGWLNPYRVASNGGMFAGMDDNNFAVKNPDLVISSNDSYILDPGEPQVQNYIRDVIKEIYTNYPEINGIHFDDYFYLSTFGENQASPDYQTYLKYRLNSNQSIADYRRMSVTKMIQGINDDLDQFNQENDSFVKFGISPSGIWANSGVPGGSQTAGYAHYSALYADTKLWIEEGYIDYIIPQIYWPFTQSVAPYGHLVDWWSNVVKDTDVHLIIGMGLYRYREQNWYTYEFAEQLRYNQNHDEVSGFTMFTYQDLVSSQYPSLNTVREFIMDNYWTKEAVVPWDTNVK